MRFAPGALVPALIGVLTAAALTRLLNEAEFGLYSVLLSVVGLVATLASQWLQQGLGRYIPGQSGDTAREFKSATGVALAVVALAVTALSMVASLVAERPFMQQWGAVFWPGLLFAVGTCLFNPLTTVLQAELRPGRYTLYQVANVVLRFGLSLVAMLFVTNHWSGLVWGNAIGTLIVVPFMWRDCGMPGGKQLMSHCRTAWGTIQKLSRYGFPMIGWFLAAMVLNVGDRFVLQWFRGAAEVGIYAANYTLISRGAGFLAAPILLAAHPMLMRKWSRGEREEAGALLGKIVQWFAVTGLLLIGGSVLFAKDVAQLLLGPGFREGFMVMPVVLAGEVMWQLGMYTHKPMECAGATGRLFQLAIITAVVNVVLNLLLVPQFGYLGAAWATFASYLLYVLVTGVMGRRILPWHIPWAELGKATAISVVGFAMVWLIRVIVEGACGYVAGLVVAALCSIPLCLIMFLTAVRPVLRSLA